MIKNYGFNLNKEIAEQSPQDWEFRVGAELKGLAEGIKYTKYLPIGEVQRGNRGDMMDCATRAPVNIAEAKLNYLYQNRIFTEDNLDFLKQYDEGGRIVLSDAFTSILSGTTQKGNSLKAPLEAIRKNGLIPKSRLPFETWMSWSDYHRKGRITASMLDLGNEFKNRFPMNYEKVMSGDFNEANDLLDIAGHAWSIPRNGVYPRTSKPYNHAFVRLTELPMHKIFDNYLDEGRAGDFIKQLASDYSFLYYGYRLIVNGDTDDKKKFMLQRKKNTEEVFITLGGKRYWIKDLEDFNCLKQAQPIKDVEWANVVEVDDFDTPYDGGIIGNASFTDLLKTLFKGRK